MDAIECRGPGCQQFLQHENLADLLGWVKVDDEWCCTMCGPVMAYRARREARKEAARHEVEAIQARIHADEAKRVLSGADYRAWDQFQSDLANFHRKHGKLAHRELRLMSPKVFVTEHRKNGRIDVGATTDNLEAADRAAKKRADERLVHSVENLRGI